MASTSISGDVICPNKDTADCELIFELPFEESANNYVKLIPVKSGSAKLIKLHTLSAV